MTIETLYKAQGIGKRIELFQRMKKVMNTDNPRPDTAISLLGELSSTNMQQFDAENPIVKHFINSIHDIINEQIVQAQKELAEL